MLSSGFTNAPVSKVFLFGILASSTLASITDSKYLFQIQVVPHLWPYRQAWRLLAWQLCYTNSTELLFAAMTIYHMRIIERLWGSAKFAACTHLYRYHNWQRNYSVRSEAFERVCAEEWCNPVPKFHSVQNGSAFLATLFPLTATLCPLVLAMVLRPASFSHINYLPAGATPLVFALLAQYHAAIPHVYKYRVATSSSSSSAFLMLSDKTMTYVLAAQLALSQVPGSLLAAAVGWGCGVAWRNHLLPARLMDWRFPSALVGERRDGIGAGGEGFEGLRRRLEGESRASGIDDGTGDGGQNGQEGRQRRGWGRAVLDGFRGSF